MITSFTTNPWPGDSALERKEWDAWAADHGIRMLEKWLVVPKMLGIWRVMEEIGAKIIVDLVA